MASSDSDLSEYANGEIVPDAIKEVAKSVTLNLLPQKSKRLYTAAYNAFKKWRRENKSNSFCEDVLLAYFAHLANKYSPPSLWATYSMLKTTINTYDNVDISQHKKLTAFLKRKSLGYRPKKSCVFSKENISKFLNEAPDDTYLCEKVALIFGISGALRREEFVNIAVGDVKKVEDNVLLVQIPKTKNFVPRSFTITNELYGFCWKYIQTRPQKCASDRFFLRFSKGICCQQAVGINKFGSIPKDIAEYLNLPDPQNFTGHSFRRTSATLLVDAGADITALQRHGGWKSATVAFGYIADSIKNKKRICEQISTGMDIAKRPRDNIVLGEPEPEPEPEPSTSGVNEGKGAPKENNTAPASSASISSRTPSTPIETTAAKGAYLYDPDIGLYCQKFTEEERPAGLNYSFTNCNITINGPCGNVVFNNCTVTQTSTTENKSVQTEENDC